MKIMGLEFGHYKFIHNYENLNVQKKMCYGI
jgi:hypothetical protein